MVRAVVARARAAGARGVEAAAREQAVVARAAASAVDIAAAMSGLVAAGARVEGMLEGEEATVYSSRSSTNRRCVLQRPTHRHQHTQCGK